MFRRDGRLLAQNHHELGNIAAYSQFIQGAQQTPMLFPLFHMPQNPVWKGLATRIMPVLTAVQGSPDAMLTRSAGINPYGALAFPSQIVRSLGQQFFLPLASSVRNPGRWSHICERIRRRYRMEGLAGLRRLYP